KIGQTRRVDIKNQSDSALLQSAGDVADQVAFRCPSWMDGFPRADWSGTVRMSMVQRENDVTRTHLFQETGKSINVKSLDGIRIRLFRALSGLGEVCPMKHRALASFDNPIGAFPINARTWFSGSDLSTRRDRNNLKASQADPL